MALNINRLIHHNDFNLSTKSLGTIRCGPLSPGKKFAEFEKRITDNTIDGVELARDLLQSCARKLIGDTDICSDLHSKTVRPAFSGFFDQD